MQSPSSHGTITPPQRAHHGAKHQKYHEHKKKGAHSSAQPVVARVQFVRKRDGRIVAFDRNRIVRAISKAMLEVGEGKLPEDAERLADVVIRKINRHFSEQDRPDVENIQDLVEETLILEDFPKTAKAYIIYRHERAKVRSKTRAIPEHVHELVAESRKYFRNPLGEFIFYRTYSRWIPEEGRRETWIETVDRYVDFMKEVLGDYLSEEEYMEVREAILTQQVMPSARLLWSAGKAARTNNVTAYNCSFIAPTRIEDFAELMFLSMSGAGVGFSVESQFVQQLPIVARQTGRKLPTHIIEDSKEGWCDALTIGLKAWWNGVDIDFNYSQIRPAGAPLRTMGGRASGPEPLRQLMQFARSLILSRQGKRLTPLDVHDICCKIGEVVVAGGVRRTALISLSDLDDDLMRHAKDGMFYITHPHRAMANNSAVYNSKPTPTEFLDEWLALAKSGTGERGLFARGNLPNHMPERRLRRNEGWLEYMGTNPCGEIVLRPKEFCNLSEVVARPNDTRETLVHKARIASLLGTYQSMLTNFPYLSSEWATNCNEERLLGVSVTGQWDSEAARNPETLAAMREAAVEANRYYARRFGINPSLAVTCVKPSGTVSQLVDASSGMHPRHAPYYIRRVRISATDPLFHMLRDAKFPYKPEVGQTEENATTFVLEFPVKAPAGSTFKDDLRALEQLEHWKMVKTHYTEHNPSVTVSVGDDEWLDVAKWLYDNWDMVGGLSFLPRDNHVYQLAPYEAISGEEYERRVAELPEVDFANIMAYEKQDETVGAKELACSAGTCEIDVNTADLLVESSGANETEKK
ncbi:ribonucleoside-triphosphate reductase [Candidatus Parcubacteria bacterium]|nr:MAG: ribonucleoside-triphosphate reductase [Candidatus Parcubacteria bacterium]GIW69060.1 MAG: adenosylcobalamin-dependent ribonucleoside-triphosphate reductase [Candidatus Parcubacteria bacterium]